MPSTTTSASRSAAARSPQPNACSRRVLVSASGSPGRSAGSWTSGDAGSSAAAMEVTAGSALVVHLDQRGGLLGGVPGLGGDRRDRLAVVRVSSRRPAPAGRGAAGPKRGIGDGRSSGVMTSRTPGTASARVASIRPIRARAASTVTSFTWRASSTGMSATYAWRPVTRSRPPERHGDSADRAVAVRRVPPAHCGASSASGRAATSRPPADVEAAVQAGVRRRAIATGRQQHGLDDLLVARAAAEVAGEPLLDLGTASDAAPRRAAPAPRAAGPGCRTRTARRRCRGTRPATR